MCGLQAAAVGDYSPRVSWEDMRLIPPMHTTCSFRVMAL